MSQAESEKILSALESKIQNLSDELRAIRLRNSLLMGLTAILIAIACYSSGIISGLYQLIVSNFRSEGFVTDLIVAAVTGCVTVLINRLVSNLKSKRK